VTLVEIAPLATEAGMEKIGSLELFAALVDQMPLASREDLEWMVRSLRGRPEWVRAMEHARRQAREMGLAFPDAVREEPALATPLHN
jgi:hypothetical protein